MHESWILLVFPPTASALPYPHLGIPALASYLRSRGHKCLEQVDLSSGYHRMRQVHVLSDAFQVTHRSTTDSLPSDLEEFASDAAHSASLIGFSIAYPEQLAQSATLALHIKRKNPNALLVAGGAMASLTIDTLIHDESFSVFDAIVVGDGEEPLNRIATLAAGGSTDWTQVPNCYCRRRNGFSHPQLHYSIAPVDFVTPEFPETHYDRLPFRMGKGCYWRKCTFCTYKAIFDGYSPPSIATAVNQIKELHKRHSTNCFVLTDDAIPSGALARFAESLAEERMPVRWSCSAVFDKGFRNPMVADALRRSGCETIFLGFESANERILRLMGKMNELPVVLTILKNLAAHGIATHLNVMIGFPTETMAEADQTIRFLKDNQGLYTTFHAQRFSLEKYTEVFSAPERFGITKIHDCPSGELGARSGYEFECSDGMSPAQRDYMTKRCQLAYRRKGVSRGEYLRRKASMYKSRLTHA